MITEEHIKHINSNIEDVVEKIQSLRLIAEEIKKVHGDNQAIARNIDRLLVYVKILELSISDAAAVLNSNGNGNGHDLSDIETSMRRIDIPVAPEIHSIQGQ